MEAQAAERVSRDDGDSDRSSLRAHTSTDARESSSVSSLRRAPDREGAAGVDAALRSAARVEANERLTLGRLAMLFRVRQGHHDLGFSSIGDYTRERLGISQSQFYDLAQVATALTSLPLIRDALVRGDLSWSKARELAAAATPQTEPQWLAVASQCTADRLRELIAAGRAKAPPATAERVSFKRVEQLFWDHPSSDSDDDEIDGEPAVNVVIRCPQSVRLLWWDVLRLSCRIAGSDLAAWRSVEFIAAEGLSETGWPTEESYRHSWRSLGYPLERPTIARVEPDGLEVPEPCDPRVRAQREHATCMAARSQLGTAEQLDEAMRGVITRMQRIDADLGTLLCRVADARLHRRLGYGDLGAYCRNELGLGTRKVRALIAIERRRRRSGSRLSAAYRSGVLSWHRCLVLLPVLTETTAEAWIERAQQVTARRLIDEVMWSRMACDAGLLTEPTPPVLGARLESDFRSFVQIGGSMNAATPPVGAADSEGVAFGSALLDAEIRFRAPISAADMLRSAILARRQPHEPIWLGLERLLEHARAYWLALPKHRDPVFERDGWRCTVPACSSRRNLHDHHVVFRSHGGDNDRDNRVAVCASHHQHGIHSGVVRATGKAGVGLDWELGCRKWDKSWLRISGCGEVYTPANAEPLSAEWVSFVPARSAGQTLRTHSAVAF